MGTHTELRSSTSGTRSATSPTTQKCKLVFRRAPKHWYTHRIACLQDSSSPEDKCKLLVTEVSEQARLHYPQYILVQRSATCPKFYQNPSPNTKKCKLVFGRAPKHGYTHRIVHLQEAT